MSGFDWQSAGNLGLGIGSWISNMVMASKDRKQRQEMFDQNFKLSKQQFAYEQALQEKIFQREDNAVQRRVEDLKAAGMNPILAAGQGAHAGAVVPVHAPQREYADRGAQMDVMAGLMNLMKMSADISISREEKKRLQLENEYNRRTMNSRVDQVMSDSQFKTETLDDRVIAVALSNDRTRIENEVSEQRKELYSTQVDKVKIDTALQTIEFEFKKALDDLGLRVDEITERMLALRIANKRDSRDLTIAENLAVSSSGSDMYKLVTGVYNIGIGIGLRIKDVLEEKKSLSEKEEKLQSKSSSSSSYSRVREQSRSTGRRNR